MNLLNFIRGVYRFEIIGISPERFINIANRRWLNVFNLHCQGKRIFGYIAASEFYTLSDAAQKAGVQLVITNSLGLPFLVKNYRRRIGFILGFAMFCFTLWYLSLFIWFVETVNLPGEYADGAAEAVYNAGIRTGVLSSSIDGTLLEFELEEKLGQFDLIKVSQLGCNAQVYFSTSGLIESTVDQGEPCDVVASAGGEIVSIIAKTGIPLVKPGDVVYPGDILISGLFEGPEGPISMVHSYGEVTAITEHTFSTAIDYRQTVKEPTGRIVTINRIIAFGMEIPLFSSVPKGNYSRTYEEFPLELFGFKLPITLRREYLHELCYVEQEVSREECLRQAEEILDREMQRIGGIEVISTNSTVNETNGGVRVTRYVTLLEDITQKRKILLDKIE